jgi:anaerobic selenocysteine-containing dehydrogenase
MNEMSFLLPHFLREGRGRLDVYFTRVYNPVWTNPDGFSWIEALCDEEKVGCHVALTPTWSETAFFADFVLPMGHGPERHDLHSYEQYDGQWIGFRQPVLRVARERAGETLDDTRQANPGEVWEENEFWIELSWRIDPDGSLGLRRYFESPQRPGEKLTVDDYYGWIFDNSVPGLPQRAATEGLTPLQFMRRYGAFEISRNVGPVHEQAVPKVELQEASEGSFGRVYTTAPEPPATNIVPIGDPESDEEGRRPVGVMVGEEVLRGFPTPSGRLEFYSKTLAEWGWSEYAIPTYIRSHVHPDALDPDQLVLLSTFRLPTQIHTRSANSKWLDEIAHTNPVWIHPNDASRLHLKAGALIRVETEIGYFVAKAWVTEGIRPGVVACSHHMGRWKPTGTAQGQNQMMRTVGLSHDQLGWSIRPEGTVGPYESDDRDTQRIWWTDVGVHQNLTFPVHPDPISGMHCWHQAVRVRPAEAGDRHGEVFVDPDLARVAYAHWLELTRPASMVSPDGNRRPRWLMRPLKPSANAYRLPISANRDPER